MLIERAVPDNRMFLIQIEIICPRAENMYAAVERTTQLTEPKKKPLYKVTYGETEKKHEIPFATALELNTNSLIVFLCARFVCCFVSFCWYTDNVHSFVYNYALEYYKHSSKCAYELRYKKISDTNLFGEFGLKAFARVKEVFVDMLRVSKLIYIKKDFFTYS